MKHLNDFEEDLNKCSKCGLCQSSCPLFKINPNECAVSKGKFIMLHGVTKGDLELSDNINRYVDLCLKCGKCNKYCPSGIDVEQILSCAKHEYMQKTLKGKIVNFLLSKRVFSKIINFGKYISKDFRPKKKVNKKPELKVLYFKGCVNQICPKTDNYLHKILKNRNIEIIEPNFDCCGLPFLSEGNLERFEQVAKHNIEEIKESFDFLVTDCASCEHTILNYPNYINKQVADTGKSVNWGDIIALKEIKFQFQKPIKVTFHKPCHLKNDAFFKRIIQNCENVEYVPMEEYDECCGFAGSFTIKNPKLAIQLARKKAENIMKTNADYVITTCPSCIVGLKAGLITAKKIKVVSLLEFLASSTPYS